MKYNLTEESSNSVCMSVEASNLFEAAEIVANTFGTTIYLINHAPVTFYGKVDESKENDFFYLTRDI